MEANFQQGKLRSMEPCGRVAVSGWASYCTSGFRSEVVSVEGRILHHKWVLPWCFDATCLKYSISICSHNYFVLLTVKSIFIHSDQPYSIFHEDIFDNLCHSRAICQGFFLLWIFFVKSIQLSPILYFFGLFIFQPLYKFILWFLNYA